MSFMDPLDLGLLAVASYIVVFSFVRHMRTHRDRLIADINEQVDGARRDNPAAAARGGRGR